MALGVDCINHFCPQAKTLCLLDELSSVRGSKLCVDKMRHRLFVGQK